MRLNIEQHKKQNWIAHDLMSDYIVEDVWLIPVVLNKDQPIELVQDQFGPMMEELLNGGVAGLLFKFRFFLGNIFGWDNERVSDPLYKTRPGSLRARYAKQTGLSHESLPTKGFSDFAPVYLTTDEALLEIDNATIQAALHLGKVSLENGKYGAHLTVYVKSKGVLSDIYMTIIKPFRLYIVYPTLLNGLKKQWELSQTAL